MDPDSSELVDPDPRNLHPKMLKKHKWLFLELKSQYLMKVEAKYLRR
jgi:hypothetical protein